MYLEPLSSGCLGAAGNNDERCVGSKVFCEAQERITSYGSTQACLDYRSKPSSESVKNEFLVQDELSCFGDPTEKCLGTEKFCKWFEVSLREQCITSHKNPPFYNESSTECDERIQTYGSEEKCRGFRNRGPQQKGQWVPPNYECIEKKADGTEECEGTERFCQLRSDSSDVCFGGRELGPFLLANPNGCSGTRNESCIGSDSMCHDEYRQLNYVKEGDCFRRRGFELDTMVGKIREVFTPMIEEKLLKYGENVARNAVYRALVSEDGDDQTAMKVVKADLGAYLDRVEGNVLSSTAGKIMSKIKSKAN
ncbi:hypothetical protein CDD80_3944 [Ophiocordyceps camponoti-rufipedis]|uniref:Uncharacterized protein n=1 Tax=Ophiocordyceps camponoti-rufipedis TaxID=2004952 RepID=A0A2C5Z1M2_9HYPO|nr:hypothetical protein CDD80_3944 [Ophiocordyceps camponoti-rufipedis]